MLNWIVWNRTDYLDKNGFGVKKPTKVDLPLKKKQPTNHYLLNKYFEAVVICHFCTITFIVKAEDSGLHYTRNLNGTF